MIESNLDRETRVLHVRPTGPLRADDFVQLAGIVDPFIGETGGLNGLILEVEHFPGWEDLGAVARHFKFVKNHHQKIKRVAVVTDSPLGTMAEHLASHFVAAEIRHFPADQVKEARSWIGP